MRTLRLKQPYGGLAIANSSIDNRLTWLDIIEQGDGYKYCASIDLSARELRKLATWCIKRADEVEGK